MNTQIEIANRLKEVFLSGKWIANTNWKEQLLDTTWEQAIYKIENANTIALLTFHINYYVKGLLHVLQGGALLIKDKFSFDIIKIEEEADWQSLVNEFISNAEMFTNTIEKMEVSKLHEPFVQEQYGNYARNVEGVIEHSYYHLGQVVLLKKMMAMK
jgi:uncharacterized damage-inducible protein DinB